MQLQAYTENKGTTIHGSLDLKPELMAQSSELFFSFQGIDRVLTAPDEGDDIQYLSHSRQQGSTIQIGKNLVF